MQKIIAQALTLAGFKNADEIVNVIMATKNPTVATEMILGCYVPDNSAIGCYKRNDTIYKVYEVDELNNVVRFERVFQKKKTVYFLTEEDRQYDAWVEDRPSDRNYHSTKEIPVPGIVSFQESEEIGTFLSNGYSKKDRIDESEFINTIIKWTYPEEEIAVV